MLHGLPEQRQLIEMRWYLLVAGQVIPSIRGSRRGDVQPQTDCQLRAKSQGA